MHTQRRAELCSHLLRFSRKAISPRTTAHGHGSCPGGRVQKKKKKEAAKSSSPHSWLHHSPFIVVRSSQLETHGSPEIWYQHAILLGGTVNTQCPTEESQ